VSLRQIQLSSILILLAMLLVAPTIGFAQTNTTVCQTTVAQAVTQIGVNCANRTLGTACYGFPVIESNLDGSIDPATFDAIGEYVPLADIIHLRPQAIDTRNQTWGITVLNMQASLPSGLTDNVVVIGLGGLEIENGVASDNVFTPLAQPVSVTTTAAGELREVTMSPLSANVIGQVPSGAAVSADALSQDGNWIRIIYQGQPGWLAKSAFGTNAVQGIPTLDGLIAMQSFYTRTGIAGIGGNPCAIAPSTVVVQGPRNAPVDVIINNVNIRIESTIVVRTLQGGEPIGRQMEIIVLSGAAIIMPDSGERIIVPAGYKILVNLGPDLLSLGIEGDADERSVVSFAQPTLLTQQEIDALSILERIPRNILNYIIDLPEILTPSGTTRIITRIIFNDPQALAKVREFCASGELPTAICQIFGL